MADDYAKLSSLRPELQAAMNGFGADNKYMNGKSFQTLNSFKKEVKANGENVNKDKKEGLMNKYQSRKALEADTLSKQLKNDHSLSARNLHQYQNTINPIAPKYPLTIKLESC